MPLSDTIASPALSAPVDVVRDSWGIPHIYAENFADAAYAEGYLMGEDRLVLMDLARHQAAGTLAELVGELSPSVIDADIRMRTHHLRKTAEETFANLKASTDSFDQYAVTVLTQFAAGVNAYVADLKAGNHNFALPGSLAFLYDPQATEAWTESDSILIGYLLIFNLSFDADSEITLSQLDAEGAAKFDQSSVPTRRARKGLAADFQLLAPVDPTFALPGWTGMNGDMTTAARAQPANGNLLALLEADLPSVAGLGSDRIHDPDRGSNNWVVSPQLSTTGHSLVANDAHLSLGNPPVWWMVHMVAKGGPWPANLMGEQLPGLPGIALGMNQHIAWGGTVSYIDVTDVYRESIVSCGDGSSVPCVSFKGKSVPLVSRVEPIRIGKYGQVHSTTMAQLYDVPHHGPIIPRIDANHAVVALGSDELSVRYTGYEPANLIAGLFGMMTAGSVKEAIAALDKNWKFGGQNWVFGDDQGHIGWTEVLRVPRRAKGFAPWKTLPGDGSAEWGGDMDPKYIPHAYDPAAGFLVTANNDPIGVTSDGDPFFDEPMVDGAPLYLGAFYDAGTRVGRATKRLKQLVDAGKKIGLDDMQSVQADAVSEYGQLLAPTLLDAGRALAAEIAKPGTHPELTTLVTQASETSKANLGKALDLVGAWSFDSPSAVDSESPLPAEIADSQATAVATVWWRNFAADALNDELSVLGVDPGSVFKMKALVRMCTHPELLASGVSPTTGDAILFDDLRTPEIESKRQIAAGALLEALDFLAGKLGPNPAAWRWGRLHTLALEFVAPSDTLRIPRKGESEFPDGGFPRHGGLGTVDAAGYGIDLSNYSYSSGPSIRFVCDLDPAGGPKARNVLPGGEQFDPASPHYRDQMELWRRNQTFDLPFQDTDVANSAVVEFGKNQNGRVRFTP